MSQPPSSKIYLVRTTLTTSPSVQLGSATQDLAELIIQAHPSNTANVEIGSATAQVWVLEPRDIFACPIRNPALLWGKSVSGSQVVNLFGVAGE